MNRDGLPKRLRLVAITDCHACKMEYRQCVQELLDGGVTAILFREKDLDAGRQLDMLAHVKPMCERAGALLLVSHHLDVALRSGADGVHLGHRSISISAARVRAPHPFIIGYSAHSLEDARVAAQAGADYVTLSPVFAPNSKTSEDKPLGLEELSRVVSSLPIPVVALGGIDADDFADCLRAGAVGVAAIGSLFGAADPKAAAQEFCLRMNKGV